LGTHITIAGSRVEKQEAIACDTGCNFIIKNLFFNVPARRKFLKTNSTELRHIINEFQRITLANPQVAFSLTHNDQPLMHLPATNYRQRITGVMGRTINNHLIPVNTQATILNVHGFVGTPQGSRKTAGDQFFFVNNRYMRHPYLHKAVMNAFSNLIQQDAYPSYFIYFDIDPEMIDVNIHPTKTEIKFEDEKLVWKVLNASIREGLGKHNIVPSIDFDTEGQIEIPARTNQNISAPRIHFNPDYNPFNTEVSQQPQRNTAPKDWESLYQGFETDKEDFNSEQASNTILLSSKGNDTPMQASLSHSTEDRPIQDSTYLQIKNRYILTPVKSGLMVIDQRRAHERILFERFLHIIQTQKSTTQQVLFAEAITFSAGDAALLRDIQPDLAIFGFDIKEHQENTFTVCGVPSEFDNVNIALLLEDLLESYKTGEVDATKEVKEQMAAIMARNARMKAGERLSIDQMTYLVGQLFQCSMPGYTSGGHRVFLIIDNEELEKRFK
jgi:DNA mismatch repair protein MutL